MIRRNLSIGSWDIEAYFSEDSYDIDMVIDRMYDFGAGASHMRKAYDLMESGEPNKAFTFTNPVEHLALVVTGPVTDGGEFLDSLSHEIHHIAVAIASELGIDLSGEVPAYIAGDSIRELADVICALGCRECKQ